MFAPCVTIKAYFPATESRDTVINIRSVVTKTREQQRAAGGLTIVVIVAVLARVGGHS